MTPYAPRCSGRTEARLRDLGWRTLLTPTARPCRPSEGMGYALDNGAWYAHATSTPWDEAGFVALIERWGADADWVVAPDIVCGGADSLALSDAWIPRLLCACRRVLLAVQDGHTVEDARPRLSSRVGLFVGGSTAWKLASLPQWGRLAVENSCWLHVGRVNTARRIRACAAVGASSFDGSSPVQFPSTLPALDSARRQPDMFRGAAWSSSC